MFSDLRSIIFGYTSNNTQEQQNNDINAENSSTASGSLSNSSQNESKIAETETGNNLSDNSKPNESSSSASGGSLLTSQQLQPNATKLSSSEQEQHLASPNRLTNKQARRAKKLQSRTNQKTIVDSTATALEQTLNAATTKFTEQLLPQSTSIEQLHSSSHQLLPTLKEQHEEDEQKRIKELEKDTSTGQADDELDEDFNVDSWELLDLIEPTSKGQDPKQVAAPKAEKLNETAVHLDAKQENVIKVPVEGATDNQSAGKEDPSGEDKADNEDYDEDDDDWDAKDDDQLVKGMEESWYVTPPPCFTGSSKLLLQQQKQAVVGTGDQFGIGNSNHSTKLIAANDAISDANKQPARENDLIEHPSVYIASTSWVGAAVKKVEPVVEPKKMKSAAEVVKERLRCSESIGSGRNQSSLKSSSATKKSSTNSYNLPIESKEIPQQAVCAKSASDPVPSFANSPNQGPLASGSKISKSYVAKSSATPIGARSQAQKLSLVPSASSVSVVSVTSSSSAASSEAATGATTTSSKKIKKTRRSLTKAIPSGASVTASAEQKKKKKAWENKFIVTNWADDEQDDVDDFDNLFDDQEFPVLTPVKRQIDRAKPKGATKAAKVVVNDEQPPAAKRSKSPTTSTDDFSAGGYESDFSVPSQSGVVFISKRDLMSSVEDIGSVPDENSKQVARENSKVSQETDGQEAKSLLAHSAGSGVGAGAAPTRVVRPIEPERKPGWQLKRQRSKRRPLATVNSSQVATSELATAGGGGGGGRKAGGGRKRKASNATASGKGAPMDASHCSSGANTSGGSSALSSRSTPTLMDRIGSSIVANLSNFTCTSGLLGAFDDTVTTSGGGGSSGANRPMGLSAHQQQTNQQQRLGCGQSSAVSSAAASAEVAARASESLVARKRLAKGFLSRQNASSNRTSSSGGRPSRRLKMFSHPNGCSVNRKVQTSFH